VPAEGDLTRKFTEIYVDLDGDGTFKGVIKDEGGKQMKYPERFRMFEPLQIDGKWYLVRPNISGSKLTVTEVPAPGGTTAVAAAPTEYRPLLAVGVAAPDFTALSPEGSPVHLSDFKGKVVIIDFWATWCGPCQVAMPGLERIYQGVKDQGVVVLSLNVLDAKKPFDAWIQKNRGTKYNFTFAFDTAERDDKTSIASSKYNVPGLPTMYVINREGNVAAVYVGTGNEENLEKALSALGIKVPAH
jgi:thiol-disulfide isomerase/thioredoxin